MPIPKKKYIELKAMYDFQRKVQYNKEKLRAAVEVMLEEPDIPVSYTHLTLPTTPYV